VQKESLEVVPINKVCKGTRTADRVHPVKKPNMGAAKIRNPPESCLGKYLDHIPCNVKTRAPKREREGRVGEKKHEVIKIRRRKPL